MQTLELALVLLEGLPNRSLGERLLAGGDHASFLFSARGAYQLARGQRDCGSANAASAAWSRA